MKSIRLLLRNPAVKAAVVQLGIKRYYERHLLMRNLSHTQISADACYDAERGVLSLRGNWRCIGAELAKITPMAKEVELARDFLKSCPQSTRSSLDMMIEDSIDFLKLNHGEVAALFEGAADALPNLSLRDVTFANVWLTLVTWREYTRSCSAFVMIGQHGPILGQNLDLGPSNNVVIAHVVPEDGAARLCHYMPGSLCLGMGVNEYGLTIGGGSVNVARTFTPSPRSLPTTFADLAVLGSAQTVVEAEAAYNEFTPFGPVHDGLSLVITDISGSITQLEATGSDLKSSKVSDVFATAANHFQLCELRELTRNEDHTSRSILSNSMARVEHARSTLHQKSSFDSQDAKLFLRERKGPGAWCRSAEPPDTGWTTASYVFDLGKARLHYWLGTKPSRPGWKELDLEPVFQGRTSV